MIWLLIVAVALLGVASLNVKRHRDLTIAAPRYGFCPNCGSGSRRLIPTLVRGIRFPYGFLADEVVSLEFEPSNLDAIRSRLLFH